MRLTYSDNLRSMLMPLALQPNSAEDRCGEALELRFGHSGPRLERPPSVLAVFA